MVEKRAVVGFLLVVLGGMAGPTAGQAPVASFDRSVVPAAGRQIVHLTVPEFGRWSVRARSKTGVALRLVDRMAGPGEVAGQAGEVDGRIDGFLDRGTVRVLVEGTALARGEARLEAHPFAELSPSPAPRLLEGRTESTELGDLEQRSWWLDLPQRRRVVLDAAGRHLADLRLWQNGTWLVDAEPLRETVEPRAGQPLRLLRLTADLAPGLYRLTAYGGAEEVWSSASATSPRPLHLRWGIPRRGVAGRESFRVGPLGFERFLVPGRATFFRLELPSPAPASLELASFEPADPFAAGSRWEIDKTSIPSAVETEWGAQEEPVSVTVRGAQDQAFVLQHFDAARRVELTGRGRYWVGTVQAGSASDNLDATGVLFERRPARAGEDRQAAQALAVQAVPLSSRERWARRFNLLETATLFLDVRETGTYELRSRGVEARFRLEPLLLDEPQGYRQPPSRSAPAAWDLERGLYVLTFEPADPGVAEVAIRARGGFGAGTGPAAGWSGVEAEPGPAAWGAVRLGVVTLRADTPYVLLLNDQPGVAVGPIARSLPLDLDVVLPLVLLPGEEVELPARSREASIAFARGEDGSGLELSIEGGPWSREPNVAAGERRVRVRAPRGETPGAPQPVAVVVGFQPAWQRAPLRPLPVEALARLPEFHRLAAGESNFRQLAKREPATYVVDSRQPGLYTVRTHGLLAMEGTLRTRVVPRLREAVENAEGRNVALRAYLGEGEYQTTVLPRGESAGRLGVALERTALRDAGSLLAGESARLVLGAEEAVSLRLSAETAGRYRLRALSLGGAFDVRLEDEDGWPVAQPVARGDLTVELPVGSYRALVLPRGVAGRALVRWDHIEEAARREGHGPHRIHLGTAVDHVWTETSAEGAVAAQREPDRFLFSLPAQATVTVEASGEMEGDLVPAAGSTKGSWRLRPGRPLEERLAEGDYELRLRAGRRNHLAPYRLTLTSRELLAGETRAVQAPAAIPVSIGSSAGGVEIESFGSEDVRARLLDDQGRVVAEVDDRAEGWDFLLGGRWAPGLYTLRVEPVGQSRAAVDITMRARAERAEEAWRLATHSAAARGAADSREVAIGRDTHLLPLEVNRGSSAGTPLLLVVGAMAAEPLRIALETKNPDGTWRERAASEGRQALAAWVLGPEGASDEAVRLVVRSLEGRASRPRLTAWLGDPPRVDEASLAGGVTLSPLPGVAPGFVAARVTLARPGCFEPVATAGALPAPDAGWWHARRAGDALRSLPGWTVAAGDTLWLGRPSGSAAGERLLLRRAQVGERAAVVRLEPAEAVVCDVAASGGWLAMQATAPVGQPVLRGVPRAALPGSAGPGISFDRLAAVEPGRSLTAFPAAEFSAVEVRNAGSAPIEARLSAVPLAVGPDRDAGSLAIGGIEETLAPRSARRFLATARGPLWVDLALEAGVAARVLPAAGSADSARFLWAGARNRSADFLVEEGLVLWALNPGDQPAHLRLGARPPSPRESATVSRHLRRDQPFEMRFDRRGTTTLRTDGSGGDADLLEVRGATAVTWVGAEGNVRFGDRFTLPAEPGLLSIEHPPGLVAARLRRVDTDSAVMGGAGESVAVSPSELPATLTLEGRAGAARFEIAAASLLVLRGAAPVVVTVETLGGARTESFPGGVAWTVPVPAGGVTLRWRGFAGEVVSGVLSVERVESEAAAEGIGLAKLVSPGGARAFTFTLEEARVVGVGVRSSDGLAEVELFSIEPAPRPPFRTLGTGAAVWRDLPAGPYLLAITLPVESRPARVEPVFVGLDPPPGGPPEDVVRLFVEAERGDPAPARATEGDENRPRSLDGSPEANGEAEREPGEWDDSDGYDVEADGEGESEGDGR